MSRSKICRAIADCSATQCSVLPAAVLRRLSVLRGTSTIMAENEQKNVPSELIINEKWDTCLERTVINFGIGLVSAGVAGVVLTRAPGMRRAVMGFGAGCGVGSSWVVCSQDFAKK